MSVQQLLDKINNNEFIDDFSKEVWETTFKDYKDNNLSDTFRRVAEAVSKAEKPELQQEWNDKFYDLLSGFKFCSGGRVYSNAGTEWKGTTWHNCFVGPKPDFDQDSIEGIYNVLLAQAKTLAAEGGWGMNFSFIRPRGAFIHGIGVETPGAVKYMELFDKSSDIITSGSGKSKKHDKAKGKIRKGAMMGVLGCWHPDIEEFITAKQKEGRLTKFNISVGFCDEFMDKIVKIKELEKKGLEIPEELDKWDLVFPETTHEKYKTEWKGNIDNWKNKGYPVKIYKTISVRYLWKLAIKSTYDRNDPGVFFGDIANKTHCWNYGHNSIIETTNPCLGYDTLVYVADGRGTIKIGDLAKEGKDINVFCLNNEGGICIRKMRNPRLTGFKEKIYKVTFDDGNFIRCTKNHKFLKLDGDYCEVNDLKIGDSLKVVTKFEASIKDIFPKANSRSQDYYWIDYGPKRKKSEHRLIAEQFYGEILSGYVVHHKNYNSKDNSPSNLEVMTKEHHDYIHSFDMIGDKNPMRRAKYEWSEEKWQNYRNKMSESISGDGNGRWSGFTNQELLEHGKVLTSNLGRRFSNDEWKLYAEAQGLPQQFSEYRVNELGSVTEFSKNCAKLLGFEHIDLDPRLVRTNEDMVSQGYVTKIEDHRVYVQKKCEVCEEFFFIPHERREQGFCSNYCTAQYVKNDMESKEKRIATRNKTEEYKRGIKKKNQIEVFNQLKHELGRLPFLKEWEERCENLGLQHRIGRHSPFRKYKQLKEEASNYNHKVVSIEEDGFEDVYNGTVDEFHNFLIGGFESTNEITNKKKWHFLINRQCGEQPLAYGSNCDLGSMNLVRFYDIYNRKFDFKSFKQYVKYAVRFLDNIDEISPAPLKQYEESMRYRRRIGLGVMGWGSLLYLMKIRFGSKEAFKFQQELMGIFTLSAVEASIELAQEKGKFRDCDPEKHANAYFWKQINLPKELVEKIRKYGIRNSALFSIQPTGNTSIFANVISGGLEPLFSHEYIRTVIVNSLPKHLIGKSPSYWEGDFEPNEYFKLHKEGQDSILKYTDEYGVTYKIDKNRGLTKEVLCQDFAVRILKELNEWNEVADWATTATSLSVEEHINDMMGFCKFLDAAASKTINVSNNYPFEDFEDLYLTSYKTGYIKGLTTYREGTMTSVLSTKKTNSYIDAPKRPKQLPCDIFVTKVKKDSFFVIVGQLNGQPYECFAGKLDGLSLDNHTKGIVEKQKRGHYSLVVNGEVIIENLCDHLTDSEEIITRLISTGLRHKVDLEFLVHQIEKTKGDLISFGKALARIIKKFIPEGKEVKGEECPNCSAKLIRQEGCVTCSMGCGYSKCG